MSHARRRKLPPEPRQAEIDSLSHDGRGIARINGKTVFISGALPHEQVLFNYTRQHAKYDEGQVIEVIKPATIRVTPKCAHFEICGGCSLQHLEHKEQINLKQNALFEQLAHFGHLHPETLLPPIIDKLWGYRYRARLSVKYVEKKQRLLIGFHEKNGRYVADIKRCEVLHPCVGTILEPLNELLSQLTIAKHIPQIEVAIGTNIAALIMRHLEPLSETDAIKLAGFAAAHNFYLYLQPGGLDSIHLFYPLLSKETLSYKLNDNDIEILFSPTDFTQVNSGINNKLVKLALELIQPQPTDNILDLFCGLGNFTLPLAKYAANVIGVEGDGKMVARASANAIHNSINNAQFYCADLNSETALAKLPIHCFEKILLDPPRTGALAIVKQLANLGAKRIVYVSCNPATLARDAAELVHNQGYTLIQTGILDMFPHTSHVESIALFEKLK